MQRLPRQLERHGIATKHLSITKPVWQRIVPYYTREAGVRGLDKVPHDFYRFLRLRVVPAYESIDEVSLESSALSSPR